MQTKVRRQNRWVVIELRAQAIRGKAIANAMAVFLALAAGECSPPPHFVLYVGHNGLMDAKLSSALPKKTSTQPIAAGVLACASDGYFAPLLAKVGAERWLTTTNLLAPEGYVVDAAVRTFAARQTPQAVQQAAGDAYAKYQKLSRRAGRRVFTGKRK
ncbi:MAG: hypothetical protein GY822_13850 [Deltaproteobacteria bacterium]|nr:hypothetical protein [Deltaproteobacteria bacterium]